MKAFTRDDETNEQQQDADAVSEINESTAAPQSGSTADTSRDDGTPVPSKGTRGTNRYGQLVVALVAISFGTMTGCAKLLEVPEELERIDATFFYDPMSASLPSAHAVKLREQRHIRRVVIHSIDRMRNTDIYVRTGEDRWVHVKQFKGWIEGVTSVDIRAEGDAVRVIPKTHALGLIKKVEVFALPKPH